MSLQSPELIQIESTHFSLASIQVTSVFFRVPQLFFLDDLFALVLSCKLFFELWTQLSHYVVPFCFRSLNKLFQDKTANKTLNIVLSVVNSSFCLFAFLSAQAAGVKNLRKLIFLFLSSSLIKPVPLNSTVHVFIQSKLFFGRIEVEIGFHDGSVFLTLRDIFGYYSKLKNYFC